MGQFDESMERNLRLIAEAVGPSGLNISLTIDDRVGLNNIAGAQISPATDGSVLSLATGGVQSGVTVSTTAVLLAGSNPLRKSIVISHIGASGTLYVGPTNAVTSGTATAGNSIASASAYVDSIPGIYTGTIWGIMDKPYSQQSVSVWDRV